MDQKQMFNDLNMCHGIVAFIMSLTYLSGLYLIGSGCVYNLVWRAIIQIRENAEGAENGRK